MSLVSVSNEVPNSLKALAQLGVSRLHDFVDDLQAFFKVSECTLH